MENNPITLGQFRKITENLSDDIELHFNCLATGRTPICTMDAAGNDKLILASHHYGESFIDGILRAVVFLKKKV